MKSQNYDYTHYWFGNSKSIWDDLVPKINPTRILEIGSYEGASACYMIEKLSCDKEIEIHCIDTWEGGIEHKQGGTAQSDMSDVETRFHHNIGIAVENAKHEPKIMIHKGFSDLVLSELLANGMGSYFDFIYVDGSHQAPDVLFDALLSFKLLKINGFLVFDDYLWQESLPQGHDPIRCPKVAIDAFTNIYCRSIKIVSAHLYQLYVQKTND